ncbi:MAG: glutamate decarboxylase [Actinobacteria bacterium]|jgi:glutamate decarboxylase|uniref:glutamate decarboxylase n=1 Tax=freshwater metagenome TaxID=449393 RepID=A0A6J7IYJ1_9ZZZZ|nr:glutamate decarboxylase [Actinomycetota bacterium]
MPIHHVGRTSRATEDLSVNPMFARKGEKSVPRHRLPDDEMLPETAYQIVHDEAMLDGNARLNLATFVGTWMEPQAAKLYSETFDKNMIDKDEYPQTAEIEERCVRILADLWHAPGETIGTSAIGSSEACMLGGLAFKRSWQNRRRAEGKPIDKPNLIMSSGVQVVWEKFCNYWDVEPRYVPVTLENPGLTAESMLPFVDENTIGVVVILGVTYTGLYEPVQEIAAALDDLQKRTGLDVPIHVDGASGGMIAPFLQPDLVWDFRLERVHSINTSGHKYGLVYPGLGWVVWRKTEHLPEDLIFHVSYLGGDMPTLALNFSRPGAQVLLQYYNFLRLGREGYRRVQQACQDVAVYVATEVVKMPAFSLLTDGTDIPVFAWQLKPGYTANWDLSDLSERLRHHGWQVPSYPMPADIEDVTVMRVVVRNGFSMDLASLFVQDLQRSVDYLDRLTGPMPKESAAATSSFHH